MASSTWEVKQAVNAFAVAMGVPVANVYEDTYLPFGAVVGQKWSLGHWTFWVQKSVLFGFQAVGGGYKSGFIVLDVNEVWPNGAGQFRQV